jgi:hypothetical protein
MPQTTWATVTDVADITGETVDDNTLQLANEIVEGHVRRIYELDAGRVSTRDAIWLKRAVAWQAAWLPGQDDIVTRLNIKEIAEGGRATVLDPTALELAPLAKRNLDNCSWRRSRSGRVRSPFVDGPSGLSPDPTAETNDFYHTWRPM